MLSGVAVEPGATLTTDTEPLLGPPKFSVAPTLTIAPNPHVPLAAAVELVTNIPTRVVLEVSGGGREWTLDFDGLAADHALPLVDLRPGTLYTVTVTAVADNDLLVTSAPLAGSTAPLPGDFPAFSVTSIPALMEPGVTMFGAQIRVPDADAFLIIVNEIGDVVWYRRSNPIVLDARRMDNGNLLFLFRGREQFVEEDVLGNRINTWHMSNRSDPPAGSIPIATDSVHHEVYPLPSGSFLFLSSEVRSFAGYPTSELDPTPQTEDANVVGDVVVEAMPDGTITGEWLLFDVLDPYRVAYDSFGDFFADFYSDYDTPLDWSHGNAVIPDFNDGSLIVSNRYQDAVVKFDRSGNLRWILGPHENWLPPFSNALLTPVGEPFRFPYHPHATELTPSNTLLLFDNGNYQASPPDPKQEDTVSRAVEYSIDEDKMEVSQLWSFGEAGEIGYCSALGDADVMPATGNVLIVCGRLVTEVEGDPSARVVEVTHDVPGTKVFELLLTDDNPDGLANRLTYRAERLSSVQP